MEESVLLAQEAIGTSDILNSLSINLTLEKSGQTDWRMQGGIDRCFDKPSKSFVYNLNNKTCKMSFPKVDLSSLG